MVNPQIHLPGTSPELSASGSGMPIHNPVCFMLGKYPSEDPEAKNADGALPCLALGDLVGSRVMKCF